MQEGSKGAHPFRTYLLVLNICTSQILSNFGYVYTTLLFLGFYKRWGCYNNVCKVHVKNVRPPQCPLNSAIITIAPPPLDEILIEGLHVPGIYIHAHSCKFNMMEAHLTVNG